jgi:hypothetical protein
MTLRLNAFQEPHPWPPFPSSVLKPTLASCSSQNLSVGFSFSFTPHLTCSQSPLALGVVIHNYNPSAQEAEAGGLRVQVPEQTLSPTLFPKKKHASLSHNLLCPSHTIPTWIIQWYPSQTLFLAPSPTPTPTPSLIHLLH